MKTMDIVIETLTGNVFDLRVSSYDSIFTIKAKIQRHEGIPISQQHLIWHSTELDDDNCLEDYGVYEGASLKLVLSMRGGPINIRKVQSEDSLSDLESLIKANSDDLDRCCAENKKLTLLVYKEGEQYRFCRFWDLHDDKTARVSPTLSHRSSEKQNIRESFLEDLGTKKKVMELQRQMEKINLRKKNKRSKVEQQVPKNQPEEIPNISDESSLLSSTDKIHTQFQDTLDINNFSLIENTSNCKNGQVSDHESFNNSDYDYLKNDKEYSSNFKMYNQRTNEPMIEHKHTNNEAQFSSSISSMCQNFDVEKAMKMAEKKKLLELYSFTSNDTHNSFYSENNCNELGQMLLLSNKKKSSIDNSNLRETLSSKYKNSKCISPSSSSNNIKNISLDRTNSFRLSPSYKRYQIKSPELDELRSTGRTLSMNLQKQLSRKPLSPTLNLPPVSRKKKHTRCYVCNKKTGLATTYTCRCGGIFCTSHRYPELHKCNYDFKNEGRKLLNKNNPVITGAKLPRI